MLDACTCGAQPPADARFCHRCGRPLTETAELEIAKLEPVADPVVAAQLVTPVVAPLASPGPSFQNPVAVRAGLSMAGIAILLTLIPVLNLGAPVWQMGAGFFSVVLFARRTGRHLSLREGAQMGWITGVLNAVFVGVLASIAIAAANLPASMAEIPPQAQEVMKLLQKPLGIAMVMFQILFILMLCTLGGLLAARVRLPRA